MRTQSLWRSSLLMLLAAVLLLMPLGTQAQLSQDGQRATRTPATSFTIPSGSRARIIVELNVAFQPEGLLAGPQAVQFQRGAIDLAQKALLARLSNQSISNVHTFEYIPYIAMEVDSAALKVLSSAPEVVSITEDIPVPPTMDISNPIIGAPTAWAAGATGAGQTVAVLDTGVDKTHAFLTGKVVSEACYSTNNPAQSSTSVCPGGVTESTASGSGMHCDVSVNGCNHGTHVAGTVAGNQLTVYNPDQGQNVNISGVAPGATVIAMQVFSRFDSDTYCGSGNAPCVLTWTTDQIKGLERVFALHTTYNIASVNMSLGGGKRTTACDSDSRKAIIDTLRSVGIATVIASGNDGYSDGIGAPACISTSIAVGSTTAAFASPQDRVSSFSNSSNLVTLLAPGQWIFSSVPGGSYEYFQGTSMATPHVAGTWAVLKSAAPGASVTDVLNALTSTGVPVTATRSGYPNVTKPRIQVDSALNVLFPAPTSLAATAVSRTQINLSWSQSNAYETSFKIERSPNGSSGWTEIGTAPANATSYNDTSASCNTTYYYRARAASATVNSAYSNTASATTTPCSAELTLSANSLSYGNQPVGGTSAAQTITITNSGTMAINVNNIAVSGDFARAGGTCPTSFPTVLAIGASCTVRLTFSPTAGGTRNGTLTITSNATGSPHTVSLSGVGVPSTTIVLSSNSLSYGNMQLGNTSTSQTITITNSGSLDLSVSNIAISGDFTRTGGTCPTSFPGTVAIGGSCTIVLVFTPTIAGSRSGTLTITSNAIGTPHTISLSGTGTAPFVIFVPWITK